MKLKPTVFIKNNQKAVTVTPKMRALVKTAITATLDHEQIENKCEVSVTFSDNEKIRALNRDYRNIDRATDVLSFPLYEKDELEGAIGELMLGDIVLSLERAGEQAEEYGHSFEREVAFLCVHSMLHLLGYDHENESDEEEMRAAQREIMDMLRLSV